MTFPNVSQPNLLYRNDFSSRENTYSCGIINDTIHTVISASLAPLLHTSGPVTRRLTRYSNNMNRMFRKLVYLPHHFGLLHHVKKTTIRLVFLCSALIFCLFLLSLDSIHKQCDNNPSGSSQSAYLCKLVNTSITNSDIRSLNSFNDMLPSLSHIYWLDTVPVRTRQLENWYI